MFALGAWSLQWSTGPEDGATLYLCEGEDLTLPWTYTPDGERTILFSWRYNWTTQIASCYVNTVSTRFVPRSPRVQFLPNAGIVLSHLTLEDTGNYTVVVDFADSSGAIRRLLRSVFVNVASESQAIVSASQQPVVAYNKHTDQYHVQLICTVTSQDYQPPAVNWTTPSQQTIQTSAQDGEKTFSLQLDNPVEGGNYSCRLPPTSLGTACPSVVYVDEAKARFAVLEAGQQKLRTENNNLKAENSQLKQRVQTLEARSQTAIFHARLQSHARVSSGEPVIPTVVSVNDGDGYDSSTGEFVVPYSGHYFFTATTASVRTHSNSTFFADLHLMVDESDVSHIRTKSVYYFEMGTCSYAGHLTQGQRVWLKASRNGYFHAPLTTFSGFLVSPDSD